MKNLSAGDGALREGDAGPAVDEDLVQGERGWPSVARTRSLQSRVSSIVACTLIMALGAGVLAWYYTSAFSRQLRARQAERTAVASRAQGEIVLPAIGKIEQPVQRSTGAPTVDQSRAAREADTMSAPPLGTPSVASVGQLPVPQSPPGWVAGSAGSSLSQYGAVMAKAPERSAFERRTAGAAFARSSESGSASPDGSGLQVAQSIPDRSGGPIGSAGSRPTSELPTLLQPSAIASARAEVLPTKRFLLPKGAFIDCTLETAIDSTLPGMTTCITATDTFGVDGDVVLLERGTKLIGETRGQVQQGAARVFVLWTSARTPSGVVVPLDSPGADELGRSGLAGEVDRHFWERFGAAILISTLDGAVQAGVQAAGHGSGAVIYNPSTSEGIATDVLKSTVNIAPTVTKQNGDRIQILVARDVDFRGVYELRRASAGR